MFNHTVVVSLMLQRGGHVTLGENVCETPLMLAALVGGDAIVRALLEHGDSDVNAQLATGSTACHRACSRGHARVLRQLLEAGADTTVRDADGCTPGDLAASNGHQACVAILQEWDRAFMLQRVRRVHDASSTAQ